MARRSRLILFLAAGVALLAIACVALLAVHVEPAIRVGTAVTSQTLCGEVFVSGLDPARVFAEEIEPRSGMRRLFKRLRYTVDAEHRRVVTTWAGHFAAVATYHAGYGCTLGNAKFPLPALAPSAPEIPATPVAPANPQLAAALDRAFAEPAGPPFRRVRAIVVMRDGKIVAERYAPGIGPDTPLIGYSASKSVIHALAGILVHEGKLSLYAPAPVRAWSGAGDPRRAITLDNLLRMTSGLDLTENDSGLDPVSRMMFLERDMAAFAEKAPLKAAPGTAWEYTSGNTLIVSAMIRDAVGGRAEDVLRFAHAQLFDPLGMRHVTMEFDDAGTPIGCTRVYASARDWARFGELYLNGGVVNGTRILPPGWAASASAPTLDSPYGSGFWTNAGSSADARGRVQAGMPPDSYYASGNFGQRIAIVPSQRLVIVRFGATVGYPGDDIHGLTRLVADVIAAR
ncbi:MAG TPA: serine hydrolase [Terracidiphilus sp.]|nr:serine hydrolase [Terracidiphilus sp.]